MLPMSPKKRLIKVLPSEGKINKAIAQTTTPIINDPSIVLHADLVILFHPKKELLLGKTVVRNTLIPILDVQNLTKYLNTQNAPVHYPVKRLPMPHFSTRSMG